MTLYASAQQLDVVAQQAVFDRLRNSMSVDHIAEAIEALKNPDARDAQGNTALHIALFNPQVLRNPRLAELVVDGLISKGCDPLAKNHDGLTPRDLAKQIRAAENISDQQYGAIGVAIWKLEGHERAAARSEGAKCRIVCDEEPTPTESERVAGEVREDVQHLVAEEVTWRARVNQATRNKASAGTER